MAGENKGSRNRPTMLPEEDDLTGSIDLEPLFSMDVTESGSFDLRRVKIASFTKLLQALSVPTLLVTEEGLVQFANMAFANLGGQKFRGEGKTFRSIFSNPGEARAATDLIDTVLGQGKPHVIERMIQIHRRRIWARMHARTIRLGRERMVLVQIENLSAQKQLEAIRKYKKLVDIFPIGIVELAVGKHVSPQWPLEQALVTVLGARVVDGNNEFAAMHERTSARDLYGMQLGELFPAKGRNRKTYEDWIRDGFPIRTFETQEVESSGGVRFFENALIANMSGDRLLGLWWLQRDISERKRQEEELMKAQKLESLGILAGGIAHDFNNLLTGIMGNLSLLEKSPRLADDDGRRLEAAMKASVRAQTLTHQVLTFSRGGFPIKRTGSVGQLLVDSVEFSLRGSNVRSELSIPDDLWPVDMDEGQIHQVIHNLLINAVQAMPEGGAVKIGADNIVITEELQLPLPSGRYVRISVRDEGVGIAQENLGKVFDPYFTTKAEGTGLGLATAYSVVKKHGGLITVGSKVGSGSTFCFYLPASSEELRTREHRITRSGSGNGRILLMDDDETVREMASELLSALGYEPVVVRDGREAINSCVAAQEAGIPFDAVILDLTVAGGMGGCEALQEILKIDPSVKAIASSGYFYSPMMSDFAKYGFVDVLPKPYDADELSRLLGRILGDTRRQSETTAHPSPA
jgi:two-component system cell cycle sensor histidine kinase/response regulator CckA